MDEDTDARIGDAYDRLGSALAPPPDVAAAVEREVVARRRRRRAAWVGVAALVAAGTAGAVVTLGGGDSPDGDAVATDPGVDINSGKPPVVDHGSFVLTRADGSTHEFTELTVSCETDARGEKLAAGHISLYSPFDATEDGKGIKQPFFYFEADVSKAAGKTFSLPEESGGTDDEVFILFAADPGVDVANDAAKPNRANEVSSAESGAAGEVKVLEASCGQEPVLELDVDATLGSEVQQGTEKLAGSYR